uniref:L-xylulose reductase-like n=1 Tax=Sinocyclocheilus anshuiensis TaxID=1608454 RepID=A0A671RC89_9TELE
MEAGTPKRVGSSKIGRGFLLLTDRHMTRMNNFPPQSTSMHLYTYLGILAMGSIETTDMAQFDKLMSADHLTHLCVPHLIKTKGSIVSVSSVNGQRSFPGVLAYCMSKSAIDQFTRCVTLELASKQVRVNAVCPGVIITEVHKRAGLDEDQYAQFLEKCKVTHALGRPGEVEEVAHAIAFLASDAATFITGVNLPVDGGRHAMCPW